jgi:hypothetical protein
MGMKINLGLAAFAVAALLMGGTAYWAFRENSQLVARSGSAGAPPALPKASASPAPPASQSASTAPPSQTMAPPAPAPVAPSNPTVIAQSNQPPASPASSPATSPSPAQAQPPVPSPAIPALTTTLPAEGRMSEADRRQIQKMLQGMNYYQGPINGKFGPLTRAAIRRYQDSIGAKSTGYLTATEATRLASTH